VLMSGFCRMCCSVSFGIDMLGGIGGCRRSIRFSVGMRFSGRK